jgi:hypothetical protein
VLRVKGQEIRVYDLGVRGGFRVSGFRPWGLRFRVSGV